MSLMATLMAETVQVAAGFKPKVFPFEDGDTVGFAMATHDKKDSDTLRDLLSQLEDADYAYDIKIDAARGQISSTDKNILHQFFMDLIATNDEVLITPDMVVCETPSLKELDAGLKDLYADPAKMEFATRAVLPRPYTDQREYEIALYKASKATLSIPITHIYRCICAEDKIGIDEIDGYTITGGYN